MVKLQLLLLVFQTPRHVISPTPTPSPTPDEYLPSISTAINNFVSGTSGRELSWMIVSLGLIVLLRVISALDIRKEEGGSGAVVAWILGFMCWCTVFYLIGYHKMVEVQPPGVASLGILLLVASTLMALISTLLLHNKTRNWRDLIGKHYRFNRICDGDNLCKGSTNF
ncbi:MAG TPA: hypothetical protein VGO47_09460 [Chlamydiales bacterium]|jgi:hypothetical protein|nr:hypothetical protein [Chlamydiales bacterium]